MDVVLHIFDTICFSWFLFSVIYLLIFAVYAQGKKQEPYPPARRYHKFLVLYPAYQEDKVICESVGSFFKQDYPSELYHVQVISDGMKSETDSLLNQLGARVINVCFENSSKAAALNSAIAASQGDDEYDIVVILDADNIVEPHFLRKINDAYDAGIRAIQAHRKSKGAVTDVAILDTVSEEINNSIFREGHIRAGLSSALIGSGMAVDYKWFTQHIPEVASAGEDKELELLLLKDEVYIDYQSQLFVYDEKTSGVSAFYRQRRRWIAAQVDLLRKGFKYLPQAIYKRNWDYCDKVIQWLIPPRVVLVGLILVIGIFWLIIDWSVSLKWWFILFLLLSSLSLAMPDELYNPSFRKALRKLPLLFLLMIVNIFRTKGVNKQFIHTKHGGDSV